MIGHDYALLNSQPLNQHAATILSQGQILWSPDQEIAILTPMWEPVLGHGPTREERLREFVWDTPLRRFGNPEEVAAVALLLATDEAAYMTGSELTIDGGILAGSPATPRSGAG